MKISGLDTPCLVVDTAVLERNIRQLGAYCAKHDLRLRPHTKTHKVPEIAKLQIQYGAKGITVAKVGEAEVMAQAGLDDILVCYPVFGDRKWERLAEVAKHARVTVAVDSRQVAEGISSVARRTGVSIGLMVEFNTGFGRCGLPVEENSLDELVRIRSLANLEWRGILVYPGHIMGTAREREVLIEKENETLRRLMALLDSAGVPCPVVSGGNTPAAYTSHRFHGVTEIRPGTYVFNDRNTVYAEAATWDDCALSVLATVVSVSVSGKAIVDAGSKTLSGDGLLTGDRHGYGHVLEDPAVVVEDLSEEHGHVNIHNATRRWRVGDRVRIVPNHVCPAVNLHDTLYGVEGDEVVVEWAVAGRGKVR